MEERCWQQFISTGKIEDYLSYRSGGSPEGTREEYSNKWSGEQGFESNCSNCNGAVGYTDRGV